MESFEKRFGLEGRDNLRRLNLVKDYRSLSDFDLIEVPGATGFIDTNYKGKAAAAIEALEKIV